MQRVCYVNAYPYCLAEVMDRKIYGMLLSLKSVRQIVKLAELEREGGKANIFPTVSFKLNSFPEFFCWQDRLEIGVRLWESIEKFLVSKPPRPHSYCSVFKLHWGGGETHQNHSFHSHLSVHISAAIHLWIFWSPHVVSSWMIAPYFIDRTPLWSFCESILMWLF